MKSSILTFSGNAFDVLAPTQDMIDLEDIAQLFQSFVALVGMRTSSIALQSIAHWHLSWPNRYFLQIEF
jgi:hypothetical protein